MQYPKLLLDHQTAAKQHTPEEVLQNMLYCTLASRTAVWSSLQDGGEAVESILPCHVFQVFDIRSFLRVLAPMKTDESNSSCIHLVWKLASESWYQASS